jgi:hypothetical protein
LLYCKGLPDSANSARHSSGATKTTRFICCSSWG